LHAGLLPRLFPVFQRVEGIAQSPRIADIPDQHELRQRMFVALRELLARPAERHPLVLVIDDLHWTDDDSLELMKELFSDPAELSVLLVATMRPLTDARRRDALTTLVQAAGDLLIELAPLPDETAHELAALLLPQQSEATLASLVAEARGHPLFLQELARYDAAHPGGAHASLDEALWSRIETLTDESRRLLALMSTAGSPVAHEVAAHAAEMTLSDYFTTVAVLRVACFFAHRGDASHRQCLGLPRSHS